MHKKDCFRILPAAVVHSALRVNNYFHNKTTIPNVSFFFSSVKFKYDANKCPKPFCRDAQAYLGLLYFQQLSACLPLSSANFTLRGLKPR